MIDNDRRDLYRDNSYLVVQINKGFDSEDIDLSQNTFGIFLEKIGEEDARNAAALQPFLDEIETVSFRRVQKRNFNQARSLLYKFIEYKKTKNSEAAKRAAFDLHQMLERSAKELANAENGPNQPEISPDRFEWLMRRLREVAKPDVDLQYFTLEGFNQDLTFPTFISKFELTS